MVGVSGAVEGEVWGSVRENRKGKEEKGKGGGA